MTCMYNTALPIDKKWLFPLLVLLATSISYKNSVYSKTWPGLTFGLKVGLTLNFGLATNFGLVPNLASSKLFGLKF